MCQVLSGSFTLLNDPMSKVVVLLLVRRKNKNKKPGCLGSNLLKSHSY